MVGLSQRQGYLRKIFIYGWISSMLALGVCLALTCWETHQKGAHPQHSGLQLLQQSFSRHKIGAEGVARQMKRCKQVKVLSGGKESGDFAGFWLDGQRVGLEASSRGLNVLAVDIDTQNITWAKSYDIWEKADETSQQLLSDLEALPLGTVVLAALKDSGMENLDAAVFVELQDMLGTSTTTGKFREGYALIAVRGGKTLAEQHTSSAKVTGELPCNAPKPVETSVSLEGSGVCKPLQVSLVSAGKDNGNMANFYLNGKMLRGQIPSARGLNVVALEPLTWKVQWKRTYDVWEDWDLANEKVFDDLEALPDGTIVLVAAKDSGMEQIDTYTLDALQTCGASISGGEFRVGYALIGVKNGKAIAEKIGPHVEVSGELPCEQPVVLLKSKSAEETVKSDQVLFTIVSDSLFYNTRVKWLSETWGKDVPEDALMIVADQKTEDHVPFRLEETDCERGSHDVGCCKFGHAIYLAAQRLNDKHNFEWFYFADDDVYVRPDTMKTQLAKRRITKWPIAKGLLGCANDQCSGLCGGGGFLLNRKGLQKIVGNLTKQQFVRQSMQLCSDCDHWGDLAVSKLIKDRDIKLENMKGLHPWRLDYDKFLEELSGPRPPITLHYQKSSEQLHMLYRLFSRSKEAEAARAAASQTGKCVEFEGHKSCDANQDETPWG